MCGIQCLTTVMVECKLETVTCPSIYFDSKTNNDTGAHAQSSIPAYKKLTQNQRLFKIISCVTIKQ